MRKYVIVCICFIAVALVFGLNTRLDYVDVKEAIESVAGSSDVMVKDLGYLKYIAFIVEHYTPDAYITTGAIMDSDGSARVTTTITYFDDNSPSGIGETVFHDIGGLTESEAKKIVGIVRPLEWGNNAESGIFADALDALATIGFAMGTAISFALLLINFAFDAVSTAWSLITACMYILGISTEL